MSPRHAVLLSIAFLTFLPGQTLLGEQPEPPAPVRTDHYGDPLPKGVRFRLGTVRLRHPAPVKDVVWLPDGRTLVSQGLIGELRFWRIPGGKQLLYKHLAKFNKHLAKWEEVEGAPFSFSPDGRTCSCYDPEGALLVFDLASGTEPRRIKSGRCPGDLFPDGRFSVVLEKKRVRLYAVDSGKEICSLEGKLIDLDEYRPALMLSPDCRTLIGNTEDGFCCWNIGTGAKRFPLGKDWAHFFAFSPNGKLLAAVVNDSEGEFAENTLVTLRTWPEGKVLRRLRVKSHDPRVLAFSADNKLLATGGWGNILVWNLATGKQLRCFEGLRDKVWGLAFSPDGSLLAAAGGDNTVSVWEVKPGKSPLPLTGVAHWLDFVGLAADGQMLLTRSADGIVTLWDSRDGRRLRTLNGSDGGTERFLFGSDASRTLALLWQEVENGRHQPTFSKDRTPCWAFSPGSSVLAVGSNGDGKILVLRKTAEGIELRRLDDDAPVKEARKSGYGVSVKRLVFSSDGRTLAASYSDGRLLLWDPFTGRLRRKLASPHGGASDQCLAFSPDSRLLAVSAWHKTHPIHLIEVASGQRFSQLCLDRVGIHAMTFAPDNRTVVVGGIDHPEGADPFEPSIRFWDLPTKKQIQVLRGHRDTVRTLVFSPDGTSLFSGGDDYTVLCWDVASLLRRRTSSKELSAAQLTAFWTDLASKDATRAQRAVAELIQAPVYALPFLEKSLPPIAPVQMKRLSALIADLDHEQFTRRQRASKELSKLGEKVAPTLRKVLTEKPSLEMRWRIDALLEAIDSWPLSPEGLRTIRALQVLETIRTPQARRILEGLAGGAAEASLTLQAKSALQRLDRYNANP